LNPLFQIQPPSIDCSKARLCVEISSQGLSYVILSNEIVLALTIYNFNDKPTDQQAAEQIEQIITQQPFLQQNFESVKIVYSYPSSVLLPQDLFYSTDHKAMLELVYGNVSNYTIKSDFMQQLSIHNIYCVPDAINLVITRYFTNAKHKHHFSLLPDLVSRQGNYLYCIFSPGQIKAILKKEGKLQAVQLFSFKTPDDAAYYLLNFCQSFEVNVSNCELVLSGMITENSALYKELFKYFNQISFEGFSNQFQYPKEINHYPSHYFSHLFSVAACV
jgi:hypothetical protein